MKLYPFATLFIALSIGCGAKPPEQAQVKPNVQEVTTKEIETLGETLGIKQVAIKGRFYGIDSRHMGTLFDRNDAVCFGVMDRNKDVFLKIVGKKNLFAKPLLKTEEGSHIIVYGTISRIDNNFFMTVDEIQGLGAEAQAEMDQGIAEQKKAQEDQIAREQAAIAQRQKKDQEQAIKEKKEAAQRRIQEAKEADQRKLQEAQNKKEADAKREKQLAMEAKEAAFEKAFTPLNLARKDLIQEFPVPGQNGKKVGQILSELELALSATKDRLQIKVIQENIRQVKEIQAALGASKAAQTIMELEDKMAQVDGASINPTLPNWGMQNGRTTFKSVATKNTIKAGLQKDISALKKYKEGIEDLDKQMDDLKKEYGKK